MFRVFPPSVIYGASPFVGVFDIAGSEALMDIRYYCYHYYTIRSCMWGRRTRDGCCDTLSKSFGVRMLSYFIYNIYYYSLRSSLMSILFILLTRFCRLGRILLESSE